MYRVIYLFQLLQLLYLSNDPTDNAPDVIKSLIHDTYSHLPTWVLPKPFSTNAATPHPPILFNATTESKGSSAILPPLPSLRLAYINPSQYNTTQQNTTQHNTTQHNTTQHNTTQHNTTRPHDPAPTILRILRGCATTSPPCQTQHSNATRQAQHYRRIAAQDSRKMTAQAAWQGQA
jgi:hypothetical protein